MMENTSTYNLIETHPQIIHPLDGKLLDVEIVQVILPLELYRIMHTCCTEIDSGNLGRRPA